MDVARDCDGIGEGGTTTAYVKDVLRYQQVGIKIVVIRIILATRTRRPAARIGGGVKPMLKASAKSRIIAVISPVSAYILYSSGAHDERPVTTIGLRKRINGC